ncbi:mitochondrial cardiolipin hydrolase-like [Oscarella lobularis]|uniref:mitochondrial cardiolipin hydrolase-like n=1 Tax=Oscarella lobularis TaxID=121494 RepID=UPI00331426C2
MPRGNATGVFAAIFASSLAITALYGVYRLYRSLQDEPYSPEKTKKRRRKRARHGTPIQVLFFPDTRLLEQAYEAMTEFRAKQAGCVDIRVPSDDPRELTPFQILLRHISDAKTSLDICVYMITSQRIAAAVADAHSENIVVRVITDPSHVDTAGSQVAFFRSRGIEVRHGRASYLMHHKFIVIDERILINGSFNWTRTAALGNKENVMIIEDAVITRQFLAEFEKLWKEFDLAVVSFCDGNRRAIVKDATTTYVIIQTYSRYVNLLIFRC